MKYYKVYDMYSPEGQLYRDNNGVLEVEDRGVWAQSTWDFMWGIQAVDQLKLYCGYWPDAKFEEVEWPES